MERRRTEVRNPTLSADACSQPLDAPAADGRQRRAIRATRRKTVEEDGDPRLAGDPLADPRSKIDALTQGRSRERDERHDVQRADAGMDSAVNAKVNPACSLVREPHRGALQLAGRSRHGEHRAVVIAIHVDVEKPSPCAKNSGGHL
jgi:hypothetical protein